MRRPCDVMLHAVLQNKSLICSCSWFTSSAVMKLHRYDNQGGITIKTCTKHTCSHIEEINAYSWANQVTGWRIRLMLTKSTCIDSRIRLTKLNTNKTDKNINGAGTSAFLSTTKQDQALVWKESQVIRNYNIMSGSQRQVGHSILTPRQPSWVTPGHHQSAEVLLTLSRLSASKDMELSSTLDDDPRL